MNVPNRFPFSILLPLLIGAAVVTCLPGCRREAPQSPAPAKGDTAPAPSTASGNAPATEAPTPTATDVVAGIYGSGADADFWYGHAFAVDGTRYYAGFASALLPEGSSDGAVSVGQVTYRLSGTQWQRMTSEKDIGHFGQGDQPPMPTDGAVPIGQATSDRGYLLAVPAWHTEPGGIRMYSAELFGFTASSGAWRYLGSVYTGENNDADCEAGHTPSGASCTGSTGELRFAPGGVYPDITVVRSGTTLGSDGKTARTLGAADTIDYVFSNETGAYLERRK